MHGVFRLDHRQLQLVTPMHMFQDARSVKILIMQMRHADICCCVSHGHAWSCQISSLMTHLRWAEE